MIGFCEFPVCADIAELNRRFCQGDCACPRRQPMPVLLHKSVSSATGVEKMLPLSVNNVLSLQRSSAAALREADQTA